MAEGSSESAGWRALIWELWSRFLGLFRPKSFFYVFIVGLVCGGFGTWATLLAKQYQQTGSQDVFVSAGTLAIALTATGFADAMLDQKFSPVMRLGAFFGGVLVLIPVLVLVLVWAFSGSVVEMGAGFTALCTLPAVLLWALINVNDPKFAPDAWNGPAGGRPDRDLQDK